MTKTNRLQVVKPDSLVQMDLEALNAKRGATWTRLVHCVQVNSGRAVGVVFDSEAQKYASFVWRRPNPMRPLNVIVSHAIYENAAEALMTILSREVA